MSDLDAFSRMVAGSVLASTAVAVAATVAVTVTVAHTDTVVVIVTATVTGIAHATRGRDELSGTKIASLSTMYRVPST